MYSSNSFSTSELDGGEWSASRPGRDFTPGKGPPVPIVQEAGWAPEPVWTQRVEEKSFAPAGNRTPIARSSETILPELTRLLQLPNTNYKWLLTSTTQLTDWPVIEAGELRRGRPLAP
jgi:hypothetical protein